MSAGGVDLGNLQLRALKPGPANGRVVAGNGQDTVAGTPFPTAFAVAIVDALGQPVAGEPVTFSLSGRPATFVGSTQTPTVRTDANGVATAPTLVAGTAVGLVMVTAKPTSNPFPVAAAAGIVAGPADAVNVASGNAQTAAAGSGFAAPLVASVVDAFGNPVAGAPVTFAVQAGAATFAGGASTATVTTDATGTATSPALTAGAAAGPVTVQATTPGPAGSATFAEAVVAGPASAVTVASGNAQTVAAGSGFGAPLVVSVVDGFGNPVAGAPVTFAVTAGAATFSGGASTVTVSTGATGAATSSALTAGGAAGPVTVQATTPGPTGAATFAGTVVAGPAAAVSAVSGGGQTAVAGSGFAAPLVASVVDAFGNPVAGAAVTFSVPAASSSTGSVTFAGGASTATVQTGVTGTATSPALTAGTVAGPVTVTAAVAGVPAAATFALAVTAAGPARADLAVSLALPSTPSRGATVTATVTVTNAGPSAAARVGTAFVAPRGWTVTGAGGGTVVGRQTVLFSTPTLAAGARVVYTVTLNTGTARGVGVGSAAALAATPDPALRNNLTFVTSTVR